MHDDSVALIAIICIFGLPVLGWIAVTAFRFIERMEMIKRGIVPPPQGLFSGSAAWREWARHNSGFGPVPGPAAGPWQQPPPPRPAPPPRGGPYDDDPAQMALFKGIRISLVGLALLIGLSFIGGVPGTRGFEPGPWLLGGLIPMFVGIAQIIIAILSGAQLPGSPRATFMPPPGVGVPPPPGPPPGNGPPPPWGGPAGQRFEELGKPVQPPDVR